MAKKNKKEAEAPKPTKAPEPQKFEVTPMASLLKKLLKAGMPAGKFELRKNKLMEYVGYEAFILDYPGSDLITDHLIMCANRHFGWTEVTAESLDRRVSKIVKEEAEAHE